MNGLTTALLDRACRIFLQLAYPQGGDTIPSPQNAYLSLCTGQPLEELLVSPVCQPLRSRDGSLRGYTLRLGSAAHPHLKMQIVDHAEAGCVFGVDTHDAVSLDPRHPDASRWNTLQTSNRQLKERIERAWEEAGLWTFNALLRRELQKEG